MCGCVRQSFGPPSRKPPGTLPAITNCLVRPCDAHEHPVLTIHTIRCEPAPPVRSTRYEPILSACSRPVSEIERKTSWHEMQRPCFVTVAIRTSYYGGPGPRGLSTAYTPRRITCLDTYVRDSKPMLGYHGGICRNRNSKPKLAGKLD